MKEIKTILVGGNFGDTPKESSVIRKMAAFINNATVVNGGSFEDIKNIDLSGYSLIYWMPNIDNGYDKVYPKKDAGAVLICSKVLRENRTVVDAVTRIFQIGGNAVIAIESVGPFFRFSLIDALGNLWVNTSNLQTLTTSVTDLFFWTIGSIRQGTKHAGNVEFDFSYLQEFIDINRQVADKFEIINSRFFGNCSTRCSKMFPTARVDGTSMIVSKRNVSKKRLTTDDLVLTQMVGDTIEYFGDSKPSVDTPIQIRLYQLFPEINYMIHGHTYVKGSSFTDNYCPCGDVREVEEVANLIKSDFGVVNLVNHGFFMFADTLENLRKMVDELEFVERLVGIEEVKISIL